MKALNFLIGVSWVAFWIYWIAAAIHSGGITGGRHVDGRGPRFLIIIITILAWISAASSHSWIGRHSSQHQSWLKVLGIVLFYGGLALAIWARKHLGRNWGVPMSIKNDVQLINTGPYNLIRHPIYAGLIVATFGTFLALNLTWLLVFVVTAAYFGYSSIQEDKQMARQFPKTYPAYKHRTKMLIPYIF